MPRNKKITKKKRVAKQPAPCETDVTVTVSAAIEMLIAMVREGAPLFRGTMENLAARVKDLDSRVVNLEDESENLECFIQDTIRDELIKRGFQSARWRPGTKT